MIGTPEWINMARNGHCGLQERNAIVYPELAELLVPLGRIQEAYDPRSELRPETERLARRFKVSTLVILRRLHDVGGLSREEMWATYDEELARLRALPRRSGGNFQLSIRQGTQPQQFRFV